MLSRIRGALTDVPPTERPDDVAVNRGYETRDDGPSEMRLDLFVERVRDYKAGVTIITEDELTRAIEDACRARGVQKLVVPSDLPEEWIPPGLTLLREPELSNSDLERSDGVLTGCALGIAQTGTIVLDAGPAQGRRVITLLPDYHLCVIRESQVVGLVPEAVARLQVAAATPGRPITFISGPSATSDIELNRVEGVHGPRTLEVLVVRTSPR